MNGELERIWKEAVIAYRGSVTEFILRNSGNHKEAPVSTRLDRDSNITPQEY
jgi:hypothetical protein